MRILVLGGTVFLSRALAATALARGHDVTCLARGISGSAPDGAHLVRADRDALTAHQLVEAVGSPHVDVVFDVSGRPEQVAAAVAALPDAHGIYVSSVSAYADHSALHGTPATTPLHPPLASGEPDSPQSYGGLKVACEHAVQARGRATIVRPGLIVGPGDSSGRFATWPQRVAAAARSGEPFLAPLPAETPVQWIDVRDLADWLVTLAESGTLGVFDAVGPAVTRAHFVTALAEHYGARPHWVGAEDLEALDVRPWAGPRSISLWVPWAGWEGFLARDAAPALAAGLAPRSLTQTADDVLASGDEAIGLSSEEEQEVRARLTARGTP